MTSIALGTMNFGKRTPAAESERIIVRALERGVTVFDTANVYNEGESERIVGRALKSKRASCLIASKVGANRVSGRAEGLAKATILRAIDESLARLGTDYLDTYYLHVPDRATPIEESLDAIQELLDKEKIRAWGVSNYGAWEILEMMQMADQRQMPRPAVSQVIYNVLIRDIEIEYLAFAKKHPIHTTVYNPLAGGLLSGKYEAPGKPTKGSRFDNNAMYQRRYWTAGMFARVDALKEIAAGDGMSLVDFAYAWAAHRPGVGSVIVGPASVEQLDAAIDGCARKLSAEAEKRCDELWREWRGTDTSYVR